MKDTQNTLLVVSTSHQQIGQHGTIAYFTVVNLVAKPLIWSEAEGDLVVIETR